MASWYSSSRSWKYDVFLSFRREDTSKNFVNHLYSALEQRLIQTYKDDITLPWGESVGPSLLKAIEESHIAVIVFSKNYADSSWCLDELAYIMKCRDERGLIVMPLFYDVDSLDVIKSKGDYGEAFFKHELENNNKVEYWRKALADASNIPGWELELTVNGNLSAVIQNIVDKISDILYVDEGLIGMGTRLQELKSKLEIGSGGVRMVGLWGPGGSGKTTLASCVLWQSSHHFQGHCIVANIREESHKHGLKYLQNEILSNILKTKVEVHSVAEGKLKIKNMLCHTNVLIILDDVDDREQLEALAGSHKWFGDGSRIIITTRDQHLLRTRKVDEIYPISLLSHDEAILLFNRHAYQEEDPIKDYKILSQRVVSYAAGLPLALKVLGSFLYNKDQREWMSMLDRLNYVPESKIVEKLKISYDGLKKIEKELFLDIACFFRGKHMDEAMEILEACGFHPRIGIQVLIHKDLITINSDDEIDMHDLVQEMGHYIVRGEHPDNPEKHTRVWRPEQIEDMFSKEATKENDKIEALQYSAKEDSSAFIELVSILKNLRFLSVSIFENKHAKGPYFISDKLRYIYWKNYPASPFQESFQLTNLVVLKLNGTLQKELWKGYKYIPSLKVLDLHGSNNLIRTPDFAGLPNLETLVLSGCTGLIEIHPSIECHAKLVFLNLDGCCRLQVFPTFDKMKRLETLILSRCPQLLNIPEIQQPVACLKYLYLDESGIEVLPSSVGKYCISLSFISLIGCKKFKKIECNFTLFKHECVISGGPL